MNLVQRISPFGLSMNVTGSIPRGVYLSFNPNPANFKLGTIACFAYTPPDWARDRHYMPDGINICKPIVGVPGSRVSTTNGEVRVVNANHNDYVVHTLAHDSRNRPLPQDGAPNRALEEGEYLLMSDYSKGSLDSRYLGVIKSAAITRTLTPMLTE